MNLSRSLDQLVQQLNTVPDEKKIFIISPLVDLMRRMAGKLSEAEPIPKAYVEVTYPQIIDQLSAAETRTENAAAAIMEAAEKLVKISNSLPDNAAKLVRAEANKIFETASFQDLVAQHINEARLRAGSHLQDMEKLGDIFEGLTPVDEDHAAAHQSGKNNKSLLNGPTTKVKN